MSTAEPHRRVVDGRFELVGRSAHLRADVRARVIETHPRDDG
ncbi:hypothetical protein [Streptomyces zaehneri]|nr:hypothetical protein [Streptomyces sp. DSM 40713]